MKLLGPGKPAGDKSTALIVIPNPELKLPQYGSAEYFRWLRLYNTLKPYLHHSADTHRAWIKEKPVCNTCGSPR